MLLVFGSLVAALGAAPDFFVAQSVDGATVASAALTTTEVFLAGPFGPVRVVRQNRGGETVFRVWSVPADGPKRAIGRVRGLTAAPGRETAWSHCQVPEGGGPELCVSVVVRQR